MFGKLNKRFLTYFNKNLGSSQRYTAFTLAEVLITLGIIGVVASLTIPTLMNNVQQFEFKSAAKKEYSVISQAYESILSDNNGSLAGVCGSVSNSDERNCFTNLFKEKMNYSKICYAFTEDVCFTRKMINSTDGSIYTYGGTDGGLILNDGTSIWTTLWYPSCDNSVVFNGITYNNYCGWIEFDVNGFKKPNTLGKDIYEIGIFVNKAEPFGGYFKSNYLYDVMNNINY